MKALVIVDMQETFDASLCEETQDCILDLIKEFRRENMPIVVLEYEGCGKTLGKIMYALEGYENVAIVEKWNDDGSKEVVEGMKSLGFFKLRDFEFHLCGVNWSCCVKETAMGLLSEVPSRSIHLIEDACNQPEEWDEIRSCFDLPFTWESSKQFFEANGMKVANVL